jgi:hypothetical protein
MPEGHPCSHIALRVCVYYCRTYYKAVCGGEGDSEGRVLCYEVRRAEAGVVEWAHHAQTLGTRWRRHQTGGTRARPEALEIQSSNSSILRPPSVRGASQRSQTRLLPAWPRPLIGWPGGKIHGVKPADDCDCGPDPRLLTAATLKIIYTYINKCRCQQECQKEPLVISHLEIVRHKVGEG